MSDLVEKVAEELWQQEALRATNRRRLVAWEEAGDGEQRQWRLHATAAVNLVLEAEGWKLMPREATEEMIKSGRMVGDASYSEVYAAMYAAAPKQD